MDTENTKNVWANMFVCFGSTEIAPLVMNLLKTLVKHSFAMVYEIWSFLVQIREVSIVSMKLFSRNSFIRSHSRYCPLSSSNM